MILALASYNIDMNKKQNLPDVQMIDEHAYYNRRRFLKRAGMGVLGAGLIGAVGMRLATIDLPPAMAAATKDQLLRPGVAREDILKLFPAAKNDAFTLKQKLTDESVAASYNNFYEFTTDKAGVWRLAQDFNPDPWSVEVTGECMKPGKFDLDDLFKFEQEERAYRFRCVEAWAMDVPWTGFELRKLLEAVQPTDHAKYVRFVTANRPKEMPGIARQAWYPWPYFEGLRMDEAMNELTLLATGIFGRPLPRQHGAPVRLVVPWKYGYKSPKSIVRIELVREQPKTFWETLQANEYPFESNVNPAVPHPRWSQASERMIDSGDRRETLPYNGYGEFVAKLYS